MKREKNKKIYTVYLENSVIGGYFDDVFKEYTHKLFDKFKNGTFKPIISSHVIDELENGAPNYIKENLKTINYEEYTFSEEMEKLAGKYIEQKIISKKYYGDALHVASATVIGVDVLVSWNFKHIVNFNKIRLFNSINLQEGYGILEIKSPKEIIENE